MNVPAKLAAAAAATATVLVTTGAALPAVALDGTTDTTTTTPRPTPSVTTTPTQKATFENTCAGVLVWLANSPTADPATFDVNGDVYGPFPPGLTPEPLLIPVGVVGVEVVETGKFWLHVWHAPANCQASPQSCG